MPVHGPYSCAIAGSSPKVKPTTAPSNPSARTERGGAELHTEEVAATAGPQGEASLSRARN
eukprot:9363864-Alexandrium_andersonii.AAC.1